jgi:hypothetical protein
MRQQNTNLARLQKKKAQMERHRASRASKPAAEDETQKILNAAISGTNDAEVFYEEQRTSLEEWKAESDRELAELSNSNNDYDGETGMEDQLHD